MTEHYVLAQLRIVTDSPKHCAHSQEPDVRCPHYYDYECMAFRRGDLLKSDGAGGGFKLLRHAECIKATEGE